MVASLVADWVDEMVGHWVDAMACSMVVLMDAWLVEWWAVVKALW